MTKSDAFAWFDEYERRARAAPGLLALLPVAVVAIVIGLWANPIVSAVLGVAVAAGGPLFLTGWVRQRGLELHDQLFAEWGGAPTTILLRLTTQSTNTVIRDRRRAAASRVSGVKLLGLDAEQRNQVAADDAIEAAVAQLRAQTSADHVRFRIVFAENKNFGFERNLLAIRPLGILLSVSAVAVLGVLIGLSTGSLIHRPLMPLVIGLVACAALTAVWIAYPRKIRVRQVADKYAASLLDAASML